MKEAKKEDLKSLKGRGNMKKIHLCLIALVLCLSVIAINSRRKIRRLEFERLKIVRGLPGLGHLSHGKDSFKVESLTGLEALYVDVTILKGRGHITEPVFTEEQLKAKVESELRRAGIKILTKEESAATIDKAFIKLMLEWRHEPKREERPVIYHYFFTLQSGQSVRPARFVLKPELSNLEFDVVTCNYEGMGRCSRDFVVESVRSKMQELAGKFLNDYLAANPKEQSKDQEN